MVDQPETFDLNQHFILSHDSQVGNFEIPKTKTLDNLEGHNFLCKPLIEVRFEAKL
jgi:hypothetical protein